LKQTACIFLLLLYLWYTLSVVCTCWWFSPGTRVSLNNKTNRHDIAEILLRMALMWRECALFLILVNKKCSIIELRSNIVFIRIRLQYLPEKLRDTKGVIRSRKSMDRRYKDHERETKTIVHKRHESCYICDTLYQWFAHVGGFLRVLGFHWTIKQTATI
jgi:hypothetical protein